MGKKVLHVINSLEIGGAESLLVNSLPSYRSSPQLDVVDVLILKEVKSNLSTKLEGLNNIKCFYLSQGTLYNPLLIFGILKYIKKYDIIHIHLFPSLYFTVIARLLLIFTKKSVKLVYTEHSTHNKRRDQNIFKYFDKFIYSKLDFIGAISKGTKDNLVKHLGEFFKDKIEVIPNGIDLDLFNSILENSKQIETSPNFVLIQVSSFRSQKDQKTLIRALIYLPEYIVLKLVGEGPLMEECVQLAKNLNVINRVEFLGLRTNVPELINQSDVCVLSSNIEGFGLAIVEGMAMKKPCIASNIEGLSDIVKGYGLLFERGDSQELASLILKLYQDLNFYEKVASRCYERASEFDLKKMVNNYIIRYETL